MAAVARSSFLVRTIGLAGLVFAACMISIYMPRPARAADKPIDFKKDIQPIFKSSCIKCHSLDNPRKKAASGFRLDNKEDALKGGDTGHDIVPGEASNSLLYKLLQGSVKDGDDEIDAMPKARKGEHWKPLPKQKIELIKRWIDEGAHWGD